MTNLRTIFGLALLISTTAVLAEEPRPAITLRLDNPDRQAQAVIKLFRGARAPHPAAALAAWKRASRTPNRLGKPLEALIIAFNPAMAHEVRTLDGAEIALWSEPESGQPAWGAFLPHDDGSFAALATAMVLSGGAAESPLEGMAVDRVGPPGFALMVKSPGGLLIAGSRDGLQEARVRSNRPRVLDPGDRIRFSIDPKAFEGSKSLSFRRLKAALGEVRGPIVGSTGLEASTLTSTFEVGAPKPAKLVVVDPKWLDWLSVERTMATFAVAVDPSPSSWDAAFRLADRVEKVDPSRENVAPIRLRLDLLARTLGLLINGDLLPHLQGVAGWVGSEGLAVDRAFLMFHLDDEVVAGRISERIKPLPNAGPAPVLKAAQGRWLGQVDGRDFRIGRFGPSILLGWGDGVIEAALAAREHPDRTSRPVFLDRRVSPSSTFMAALWPTRVPGFPPIDPALVESPPIVWSGAWQDRDPGVFRIEGAWRGLDTIIKRFLDHIPLDPPPDH